MNILDRDGFLEPGDTAEIGARRHVVPKQVLPSLLALQIGSSIDFA